MKPNQINNGQVLATRSAPALRVAPLLLALAWAFGSDVAFAQQAISVAPEAAFTVTQFQVTGDNPIGDARAQDVLKPYLGPQNDLAGLEAARRALSEAIRASGAGLYRVVLPPQEAVGTIRLVVTRIPVTAISVSGEKYFSEGNIRASMPALTVNQSPDMRMVQRDLDVANDNPAKHVTVQFREDPDGAGIESNLAVEDKSPVSLTVGANNTGTVNQGGEARLLAYLQYANLFDADQVIGLAYTTSPNYPQDVKQYGIYYKAPIYSLGGFISASHSYSTTSTGALGSGQVITGAGEITGLAYTQILMPIGSYKSSLALGVDDKLFRSPVLEGVGAVGGDVRSRPLSLAYVGNYDASWGVLGFNVEIDHNLTGGDYDDSAAYLANRADATPNWNALRAGYNVTTDIYRGFSLAVRVTGQYSDDSLIQGEEYGLGGAASVRGAPERAVIGDSGLTSNIELYTPNLGNNVRLLAFTDAGFVTRHDPVVGEPSRDQLQSVGVGLRWSYRQQAQFALDYGYIVRGSAYPSVPTGSSRLHANLLYTFN